MVDPSSLPKKQREFLDLWLAKRGRRKLPARADFTFVDLAPWLESLHLIEVLPDGDFLFRVFATKSAIRLERELTGRRISELPRSWLMDDALVDYRRTVATAKPVFADRSRRNEDGRMYSWRRLILPLGTDAITVDHFFVCLDYDYI